MQSTFHAHMNPAARSDASTWMFFSIFKAGLISAQQRHAGRSLPESLHYFSASGGLRRFGRGWKQRTARRRQSSGRGSEEVNADLPALMSRSSWFSWPSCCGVVMFFHLCRFTLTSHCSDHSAAKGKSQRQTHHRGRDVSLRHPHRKSSLRYVSSTSNPAAFFSPNFIYMNKKQIDWWIINYVHTVLNFYVIFTSHFSHQQQIIAYLDPEVIIKIILKALQVNGS